MMDIALRRFPAPYRCALSISSDCDAIHSVDEYLSFHDIIKGQKADSYFDISGSAFIKSRSRISLIGPDDCIDPKVEMLVREGSLDTIHAWSELDEQQPPATVMSCTLDNLGKKGLRLPVWTNHSNSPYNLVTGSGDLQQGRFHHAKHLFRYGVRFIWIGALTPIWGQEVHLNARQVIDAAFAEGRIGFTALKTLLLFFTKCGKATYQPAFRFYLANRLMWPVTLRDGTRFWAFVRYGPLQGRWDRFRHLKNILTENALDCLIRMQAITIIYTHLGKKDPGADLQNPDDVRTTFAPLLSRQHQIWVCPTARLLRYWVTHEYLDWKYLSEKGTVIIQGINDPVTGYRKPDREDLQDITFMSKHDDLSFEAPVDIDIESLQENGLTCYKFGIHKR